MKRLFALLPLLALLSCQPPGGTASHPAHVAIAGAKALYLQPAGAKSVPRALSRGVTGGGELHALLPDNTTTAATFTDAKGATVEVTINRSLQLNADYLLVDYTANSTEGIAVVTLATGAMDPLSPAPDNWDRIRVKSSAAYYVSGGALQRCTLPASVQDISQGDRISGNSLLFLDLADNVHTFYLVNGSIDPANQVRIYFANGNPPDTLGWGSPDAYMLCQGYGGRYLEDEASGAVYAADYFTAQGFGYQPVTMDASGVYHGAAQVLDATFQPAGHADPATGKAFLGNVAYSDGAGRVAALTISAGAITGATERTLSFSPSLIRYTGGKVYASGSAGISSLDMASGTETALVSAPGITELEVLGDQVFYATPAGVYQYDSVSTQTSAYAGPIVEPVAQ